MIGIQVYTESKPAEPIDAQKVEIVAGKVYVTHIVSVYAAGETTVLEPGDVNIITLVEYESAPDVPRMPL